MASSAGDGRQPALTLVVLTHSRAQSLLRLLESLARASYDGDAVALHIWIDRSTDGSVDEETVSVSSTFSWAHGESKVHVWDKHVGIWGQWIDSWRPKTRNELALLLEDDLEVSSQFYRWLRAARTVYGRRDDIFGYTLQRGVLRANRTGFGRRPIVPPRAPNYLYKLVGSWGYAPEPEVWMRFRTWFHQHACDPNFHPYVDDLVPTIWYRKQERKRSMWTMWHIRYAHDHHLFTVYANLKGSRTLAASWREPGLHFRKPKNGADVKKMASKLVSKIDFELLERDATLPQFESVPPMLDWNGLPVA